MPAQSFYLAEASDDAGAMANERYQELQVVIGCSSGEVDRAWQKNHLKGSNPHR